MGLQVLAAAVNKEAQALAESMRLSTDAIIVNQCDRFGYEEFAYKGRTIRCFSMKERGVGLSRNTALLHARADIVLFSDEDIRFDEGYEETILAAFRNNPEADLITFNVRVDERRATYRNQKERRIRWYNYGRYPTYSVAARLESLRRCNVSFSLLFGGGARYSNGEDSLFLHDCLKKGMKLYTSKEEIGEEIYRESTWFKGYNEKFFTDRGVLYSHLYGKGAKLFALRFLWAHRKEMCREISLRQAYELMKKGIRGKV
jgi:glycosyltransferase involved in cell wall biosynthesis